VAAALASESPLIPIRYLPNDQKLRMPEEPAGKKPEEPRPPQVVRPAELPPPKPASVAAPPLAAPAAAPARVAMATIPRALPPRTGRLRGSLRPPPPLEALPLPKTAPPTVVTVRRTPDQPGPLLPPGPEVVRVEHSEPAAPAAPAPLPGRVVGESP